MKVILSHSYPGEKSVATKGSALAKLLQLDFYV